MMDIVWDKKRKRAVWIYNEHDLALAVRVGREVIVVPMSDRLQDVRNEFRDQAAERASEAQPAMPELHLVSPESA